MLLQMDDSSCKKNQAKTDHELFEVLTAKPKKALTLL